MQDQKKKRKMFPNAACSNSFSRVSVPRLPKSVCFVKEREPEQRYLSFMRLSNTFLGLSTILVAHCFSISLSFFLRIFLFLITLRIPNPLCFLCVCSKFQCGAKNKSSTIQLNFQIQSKSTSDECRQREMWKKKREKNEGCCRAVVSLGG